MAMRFRPRVDRLECRDVPDARLQFVMNSPYAAAATVDVFVNNALLLDNIAYQSATAFLTFPSQANLKIDITAATAANNSSPLFTTTLNLPANSTTVAVALGDPLAKSGPTAFQLATSTARETAASSANVDFLVLQGSPDAGVLDTRLRSIGVVANDTAYGKFASGYVSVPPAKYTVDIAPGAGGLLLASGPADFSASKGAAVVLMTTGFQTPTTATDPPFKILSVYADGRTQILATKTDSAFAGGTLTNAGGVAILGSTKATTLLHVTAFPLATAPARVAAADLTGDGVPDLVAGSGPGVVATVRIFNGATGAQIGADITPFGTFTGGVNVSVGDLTGDGTADLVLSADNTGGPRVRILNGKTNAQIADFFGIDDVNFRGGARTAVGDINGDGRPDLLVAAGVGGGPRVAVFNGLTLGSGGGPKLFGDFFAFEPELRNGAYIAAGDVNADGYADLIAGGGPDGGPRVRVFDGKTLATQNGTISVKADFFAGADSERQGVRVAARDVDFDGKADIITGGIPGATGLVKVFLAPSLPLSGFGTPALTTTTFDGESPLAPVYVG